MRLSEHFTLKELTVTNTGIDNTPTSGQFNNLKNLADVLERVRAICGSRPLIVSSGFRSEEVNHHVGGADTSAHLRGDAADFTVTGLTIKEVFEMIKRSGIMFDQLILEPRWIHIGLAVSPRRQCLTFDGKTYKNA